MQQYSGLHKKKKKKSGGVLEKNERKSGKNIKTKKKIEKFNMSAITKRAHLQFAWSLESLADNICSEKYYSN